MAVYMVMRRRSPAPANGATAAEWAWAQALGIPPQDLLCTVGRRWFFKKPSLDLGYADRLWLDWRAHQTTAAQIAEWSANRRLNCAVSCRVIRAIDIDIEAPDVVNELLAAFERITGRRFLIRGRPNSPRVLLPFRFEGALESSVLDAGSDGAVELLADRKCFMLAGHHPSGVRYSHSGEVIPTLTREKLDAYLATVAELFSCSPSQVAANCCAVEAL